LAFGDIDEGLKADQALGPATAAPDMETLSVQGEPEQRAIKADSDAALFATTHFGGVFMVKLFQAKPLGSIPCSLHLHCIARTPSAA
jgi:hypothetical protein